MSNKTVLGAVVIVAAAALFVTLLVRGDGSGPEAGAEAAGPLDYARGPHGARLLTGDGLQLEVTIYETGVPPHFRVYPLDRDARPISPGEVQLTIELHRLGGRIDRLAFLPEADYLKSDGIVEEPHSFDVKVSAAHGGRTVEWEYSQIEGKVQLADATLASAGIEIAAVGPRAMETTIAVPGEITMDATRLAHVVPRLQGVVMEVAKREGDRVQPGDLMAVISSRELADAKSAYMAASQRVRFARVTLDREENLWQKKISAEQELLEARRALDEARLTEDVAAQKLVALGLRADSLAALATAPPESLPRYEIRAPIAGTVIARDLTVGESVPADRDIFSIADLSSVWVEAVITAGDLARVRAGQAAVVTSADLGRDVSGRVAFVGALVGAENRSATARLVIPNPDGAWRPGLFVTVRLVQESAVVPLAVLADAIQTFRDWQVVFVRYGDWFEARPLELGRTDGTWVEVLGGLNPGERYAATNAFAVKAEIGKLGATHDH